MAKLVCRSGPSAGHEYPIEKDKTLFGRQRTCDVQVLDSMASREHFLVRRDGKLFTLVDLESRNGTLLNGRKVSERQLEFGDKIKVGQVEYLLVKEEGDLEVQDLLTRKYQVLEKIGEGGMGIVYKAIQRSMDREVALKILSPKFATRQRFVEQFTREARAAGALNHANIIQVHDVGSENGLHYFSMEFVDGVTCMEMLKTEGPLPVAATLEIIRQTAKALEYAHEHHIIHRDIKPDNIMVGTNNSVKLADLGISKTFEEAEAEGNPKRVIGTPHYMAPEAALGKPIDRRVDIYSLGATFYHLLSGRTPYSGTTATDILKGHIKEDLTPICDINPDITPRVGDLIGRMMVKNPDERIQTATEVIEVIQEIQGQAVSQGTVSPGHDTMILQRLSRSSREALASSGDARKRPRPGTREPEDEDEDEDEGYTDRVTGEEDRPDDTADVRTVRRVIITVIVVIVLVLGYQVFALLRDLSDGSGAGRGAGQGRQGDPAGGEAGTGGTGGTGTATNGAGTTGTGGTGTGNPGTGANDAEIARQAVELKGRMARATTEDEVRAAMAELAGLVGRASPATLSDIREKEAFGRQRLEDLADQRQTKRVRELEDQAEAMKERGEYLAAIKLMEDARGEVQGEHQEDLDKTIASYQEAYDNRKADVAREAKRFLAGRRLEDLRQLLADLPPALADGEVGQPVKDAIAEVEKTHEGNEAGAVKDMVELAKAWNFPEFEIVFEQRGKLVTTPALQDKIKELKAITEVLKGAPAKVAAGIRSFGGEVRFNGELGRMEDPMMVGASASGLDLRMANGAVLTEHWKLIPVDTLKLVLIQLTGDAAQTIVDNVVKLQEFTAE